MVRGGSLLILRFVGKGQGHNPLTQIYKNKDIHGDVSSLFNLF
jgi:hypothetical protein